MYIWMDMVAFTMKLFSRGTIKPSKTIFFSTIYTKHVDGSRHIYVEELEMFNVCCLQRCTAVTRHNHCVVDVKEIGTWKPKEAYVSRCFPKQPLYITQRISLAILDFNPLFLVGTGFPGRPTNMQLPHSCTSRTPPRGSRVARRTGEGAVCEDD